MTVVSASDAIWEEVDPAIVEASTLKSRRDRSTANETRFLRVIRNEMLDVGKPLRPVCRCWRCRSGGLPLGDMAQMDRILARHLLRMGQAERRDWLRLWSANPNHGPGALERLRIRVEIEQGHRIPEPVYYQKVSAW